MTKKNFVMKECPWVSLKETDQGTLFWCEKCGSIFNKGGDWKDNGPSMPTQIDTDILYCPDQGMTP